MQYFHAQYISNTDCRGKYERHPDFLRLLRSIPAYHLYLSQGDIVELRWSHIKATQNQDLVLWQPVFEEAAYHPITLLNATAQGAMSHHLDDEVNQHISVAANTKVGHEQGEQGRFSPASQLTARYREVLALFEATKAMCLAAGYSDAQALIEAAQATVRATGFKQLEVIINQSPALRNVPVDEQYTLVSVVGHDGGRREDAESARPQWYSRGSTLLPNPRFKLVQNPLAEPLVQVRR